MRPWCARLENISGRDVAYTNAAAPQGHPATTHRRLRHPRVIIDHVTDEPTPEQREQLARSVPMRGVLGDRDRIDVVAALRRLADIEKATRRHPSNRHRPAE